VLPPAEIQRRSADQPAVPSPERAVNSSRALEYIMKIENQDSKGQLIKRLRRIEGQVRGLQSMLDEERDCREIMQQLSAVSAAVKSTSRIFFRDYAALCLTDMGQDQDSNQALLEEMINLLDKTP